MAQNTETEIDFEKLVILNEQSLNSTEMEPFTLEDLQKTDLIKEEGIEPTEGNSTGTVKETEETVVSTPVETKQEIKVETPVSTTLNFKSIADTLIKKGEWSDFIIEKEEGVEVKLSEVEDLDEETFLNILQEQKKALKESMDKDYIPVKGIDENTLSIINIVKNGGDLREIFQSEAQLKKPYEGMDLESPQIQQTILYNQFLRQGLSADDAKELVIKSTKDLTLDTKVNQIVTAHQNFYEENLKKIEKETYENRLKEQEKIKEYKKNLSSLYKEDGIEDNLSKTFIEAATKYDKEGQLYIDTVYEKLMSDPAEAKELIFYMLEKEKFLAAKGASVKRDTNINNLRKIKIVQDTTKNVGTVKEEVENNSSPFSNIVIPEN